MYIIMNRMIIYRITFATLSREICVVKNINEKRQKLSADYIFSNK